MPFALNLAADVDGIFDFDIPLKVKLHKWATTKLEDELYGCVPQYMFKFLESLNNRATEFQWSDKVGIMMIPKDVSDMNTDYVNLLTNYGEINPNMIIKFEDIYIKNLSRAAQDTNIIYHYPMNSL